MTNMRVRFAACLAAILSISGCGSRNAECSLEARAGVNVSLKDAVTKKPICDAKVVITDGTGFSDTPPSIGQPDCIYGGATERTGTYKVEVTHPSYATANREGIEVKMDDVECHVVAQKVELELKAP
jgi:hypothetical protein